MTGFVDGRPVLTAVDNANAIEMVDLMAGFPDKRLITPIPTKP